MGISYSNSFRQAKCGKNWIEKLTFNEIYDCNQLSITVNWHHEKADKKNDLHDIEDSTSVQIPRGDCSTVTLHC